MKYAEMEKVEPGLRFKTRSGLIVETTGPSLHVHTASNEAQDIYCHEVVIVEGKGEGSTFLHNLDSAEQL